jgi:hypothetical protein
MRLRLSLGLISLGIGIGVAAAPVQARVTESQVNALVEALRQAAAADSPGDDLYGEWQVSAAIIPQWSKACIGRTLTPTQFQDSPATARQILTCVMGDVLREETQRSQGNLTIGVRRAASWWLTGDASQYAAGNVATYTQRVLKFYQSGQASVAATAATPPPTASKPVQTPPTATPARISTPPSPNRSLATPYDRYMSVGYAATQRRDYATARLYFQRALDERPEDTYAAQALRNVESYQTQDNRLPALPGTPAPAVPQTVPTVPIRDMPTVPLTPRSDAPPAVSRANATPTLTQEQAMGLINRWLQAKAAIFAPPFDETQATQLTTGELAAALLKPAGVLDWLKQRQAYYRYGVQKVDSVERFVSHAERATIELTLTEDRTLYRDGAVDPQQTDFSAQQIRFSLEWHDGRWKIADYKTVSGALLERSILFTNSANGQSIRPLQTP